MGDAAHTTHFSIGSGTRLAIEDAIGLADQLHRHGSAGPALDAYARERQAALRAPRRRARRSARWFESIPRYIDLEAPQFATLLARRDRFSRLLAKMPARGHWRLYRAARMATFWRRLRRGARSQPRGAGAWRWLSGGPRGRTSGFGFGNRRVASYTNPPVTGCSDIWWLPNPTWLSAQVQDALHRRRRGGRIHNFLTIR